MAFKMKSHPEGPFSKNYGIKKGGHKKVATPYPTKENEDEKKYMRTITDIRMTADKDKTLIPATQRPKEFDVVTKRQTYEYNPQSQEDK